VQIAKGDSFANRFQILDRTGTGGTAGVFKAYDDEMKKIVALKVFTLEGRDPNVVAELWNRESKALATLKNDAIVTLLFAGRDSISSQRYIVLEWIDGITLEKHLESVGSLSWEDFQEKLGKQILAGLLHAADQNVAHRDLTPGNIIVKPDGRIKIIDFGQARVSQHAIGLTVAGWRTKPYCPPEEDSGRYTYTRDPFSFSAIAIRAVAGYALSDHESLYVACAAVSLPPNVREVLERALSREPTTRYGNIIEFNSALVGEISDSVSSDRLELMIPVRLSPTMVDRVEPPEADYDAKVSAMAQLIEELNDVVAISLNEDSKGAGTKIDLETQSYRMVADIDSRRPDHLVIIYVVQKRFRLDTLYRAERWIPQAQFTDALPDRVDQRATAGRAVKALYHGLEEFESSAYRSRRRQGGRAITEWTHLLEALRHLARHSVEPLRYSNLEREGDRLIATLENPDDAEEEELRTISVDRHWVFRGEIESIRGSTCVLVSTRPRFDLDSIPSKGHLEIDWQQTKIALDRQARAVERFKLGTIPNPKLGRLLTGEEKGLEEMSFATIPSFFDESLDDPKKEIVSRCAAGIDLLVTHGPPGTGKTKLIVELIRQALKADPTCKILMVSQTHVALDNALERLLKVHPDIPCVRIGSGSTEIDPRVAQCTVEHRGKVLRQQVEAASRLFLEEKAKSLKVDKNLVELGLRALDVIGLRDQLLSHRGRLTSLESELNDVVARLAERDGNSQTTSERSDQSMRSTVLEREIDRLLSTIQANEAELSAALELLGLLGKDGRELAESTDHDLRQWANIAIENEEQRALGELMKLAEEWRLRFGQSDDFKAAIISSSSIVAGTCVGFCREDAASRATFDLCIIDEAGKATTTELLVPLAQSRRAVIVGDHHQLPAVVDYAIKSQEFLERFELTERQLEVQLFEELTNDLGEGGRGSLNVQYRMRGAIGALISTCFYDGVLYTDDSLKDRSIPDLTLAGLQAAVTWLDPYAGTYTERLEQKIGSSYSSSREIQCVLALLKRLSFIFENSIKDTKWPSIGVITGYGPQANYMRAEIRRDSSLDRMNVECATVHAFQGREVDICIYSVVRRNRDYRIGMLKDWRHLNVALSRARNFLVIVGALEFCRNVPAPNPFSRIIEFIEGPNHCEKKEWRDD
jgi:serine/threonine protein kinase